MRYDLLIKNGYVVDYATGREGYFDVAVQNGLVTAVESSISGSAAQEIDASGKLILPGLVDSHVHASAWLGGSYAHAMLIKAGVTSALDMSGPGTSVLELARDYGVGLNLATIEYVRPGHTVSTADPSAAELQELLERVLRQGSLGIKLLGGHYPLTVAATARAIKTAADMGAYTAFHAGTAEHGSNIEGMLEAVELADGNPLHLAHINAYCRGTVRPETEETELALKALLDNPNISCESYLSPLNGTSAEIIDGLPGSMVTRRCLKTGGFTEDEAGMEAALLAGWAQVNYPQGQEMTLLTGEPARDYWLEQKTLVSVSFVVNPVGPRVRLATAKKADGGFIVDAISTDGGGIPRNVLLPAGLALVDLGGLTLQELVAKISYLPAQMLGLTNKGSLAAGWDADITIVDRLQRSVFATIVGGQVCYIDGKILGRGGKIITTAAGADYVRSQGLEPLIVDLADSSVLRKARK
ncbi:dihydroorotase family protein [uncultured Phascolarctobacterium sp.]|uniref:dihydroorotase n=1 Tax=uncultured Phascolarctobacterium sp. TaxID=512296 RepID=UPI0025E045C7|nr:dihydroorotase family protein [uncultured Phascolarctobacterium sp.]